MPLSTIFQYIVAVSFIGAGIGVLGEYQPGPGFHRHILLTVPSQDLDFIATFY